MMLYSLNVDKDGDTSNEPKNPRHIKNNLPFTHWFVKGINAKTMIDQLYDYDLMFVNTIKHHVQAKKIS